MLSKICPICKKEFYPNPRSHRNFLKRKYCSNKCSAVGSKNGFQKGYKATEIHRKRNSERQTRRFQDPKEREKMSKILKLIEISEERRNQIALINLKRCKNKTYIEIYGKEKTEKILRKKSESSKISWEKNPYQGNWKDGKTLERYPIGWKNGLRELIRKRDNYTCQLCGQLQSKLLGYFKRLTVHHIDYDKKNLDFDNLITLCNSCNLKINYNRKYWIDYFRQLIIRKNYDKQKRESQRIEVLWEESKRPSLQPITF